MEDLTRSFDATLLATGEFVELVSEKARNLGMQSLRGFDEEVEVFSFKPLG